MQFEESLRELFWNPPSVASLPKMILSLAVAALLGGVLSLAYVRFGHSMSNRKLFARNFLMLTVTTTLIISIVKSSLALSLGLVGALSIVRFRAAIKEPEELTFLFLAIGIGLGLGAGQALVTIAALAVILGLIAIRSLVQKNPGAPNLYLTVTTPGSANVSPSQIIDALSVAGAAATLKRFDQSPDSLELAFAADFGEIRRLEQFALKLKAISPEVKVSCLDERGFGG